MRTSLSARALPLPCRCTANINKQRATQCPTAPRRAQPPRSPTGGRAARSALPRRQQPGLQPLDSCLHLDQPGRIRGTRLRNAAALQTRLGMRLNARLLRLPQQVGSACLSGIIKQLLTTLTLLVLELRIVLTSANRTKEALACLHWGHATTFLDEHVGIVDPVAVEIAAQPFLAHP